MRKIIYYCFIVFIVSLFFVQTSFAQVASNSAVGQSSGQANNYQLPYPGLLPDNPLYFLKVLRDKIEAFLISDPLIKASFDLRNADKRLSMGLALYDHRKYDLAWSTISKGENYFDEGIKNLDQSKKEGRQIDPSLLVSYDSSAKKHKEILEGLIKRSSDETKKKFAKILVRINQFINLVNKLNL